MKSTMKRIFSFAFALILVLGQLAVIARADDSLPSTEPAPSVEVPIDGGQDTASVEVDITVTPNGDGTITTTLTTVTGGDTTDSGLSVNYDSTIVTDINGNVLSEDTSYDVESPDGAYTAQGGVEITTEIVPEEPSDVTVDLVDEQGNLVDKASAGGESTTTGPKPTTDEDNLQSEDPTSFDQTTVTETDREVEVEITDSTVTSGDPVFLDENGDPLPTTDNGYNYFGGVNAGGTGYTINLYTMKRSGSKGIGGQRWCDRMEGQGRIHR